MHSIDRASKTSQSGAMLDRTTSRWLIIWGLSVWFVVAVLIRLAGHVILSPMNTLVLVGF